MPRGKKKDNVIVNQNIENFAAEYARNINSNTPWNQYLNPYTVNQYLKNVNMNPIFPDKDKVEQMISDPKNNEQGLRELSQRLYNTQMNYKRLVHYFADALSFDYYILPINAEEKEMKTTKFKKDYDIALSFFDKFNHVKEFKKILLGMMLEDVKYVYLRESDAGMTLQEMPSDYCMITDFSEYGPLYDFNLMWFLLPGVDINAYPKVFKKYFNNFIEMMGTEKYYPNINKETRSGRWYYWQMMSPAEGAWTFKFHTHLAGITIPMMGIFLDAIDIDSFKKLQKAKTELDVYKVIFGTIPLLKDSKSGQRSDNVAISADMLSTFVQLVKGSLPPQVDFKMIPADSLQSFDFANVETKMDVVGTSMKNFYRQTGADQALFNAEKPNATTMKASTRIDAAWVERAYEQFMLFCDYHINKSTKRYKFHVVMEGTIFDEEERKADAITLAEHGIITPKLGSAFGMSPKELVNSMALMRSINITPETLIPIQSSHTLSTNQSGNKNGRPEQKNLQTESGETTRDSGSNDD